MDMQFSEADGVTKVVLDGRLDTSAVNDVELRFVAGIVPKGQSVVVDLSRVTFMASLGIRMLLSTARAVSGRGAKFVMFSPLPAVLEIIETTALSEIIPVLGSESEALAAVAG